jgi:hypothetical protein
MCNACRHLVHSSILPPGMPLTLLLRCKYSRLIYLTPTEGFIALHWEIWAVLRLCFIGHQPRLSPSLYGPDATTTSYSAYQSLPSSMLRHPSAGVLFTFYNSFSLRHDLHRFPLLHSFPVSALHSLKVSQFNTYLHSSISIQCPCLVYILANLVFVVPNFRFPLSTRSARISIDHANLYCTHSQPNITRSGPCRDDIVPDADPNEME